MKSKLRPGFLHSAFGHLRLQVPFHPCWRLRAELQAPPPISVLGLLALRPGQRWVLSLSLVDRWHRHRMVEVSGQRVLSPSPGRVVTGQGMSSSAGSSASGGQSGWDRTKVTTVTAVVGIPESGRAFGLSNCHRIIVFFARTFWRPLWDSLPRGVFAGTQDVLDPCRWARRRFPVLEAPTGGRPGFTVLCLQLELSFYFSSNVLCVN